MTADLRRLVKKKYGDTINTLVCTRGKEITKKTECLRREGYIHPCAGFYFDNMKRTRAVFQLALRYCRNHVELKADACAESLFDKDPRKF